MKKPDVSIPCNGCTACCRHQMIQLHPEDGDDPSQYVTERINSPITGKPILIIPPKEDGSCHYLGDGGCTIYGSAPAICREFDCGKFYQTLPRSIRNQGSEDRAIQPLIDAGRRMFRLTRSGV